MDDRTQQNRIRLVLLDNHGLFRTSLARLLAMEPDLDVAGECGTPAEVLDLLKSSAVDVVLLEFNVSAENGSDFMSVAREAGYQGSFLIVAGSADVRNAAMALKLGASGIFLKSDTPESFSHWPIVRLASTRSLRTQSPIFLSNNASKMS